MVISLVVCTRNRAASLRACLDHIARLESPSPGEWELVVVDNGSSDGTAHLLQEFVKTAPFRMVLVHEPLPGLGQARNAGIAKAAGDIIAFTDDDCYVDRKFLIRTIEVFSEPTIGFMGGRVLLYDETDALDTVITRTTHYLIKPYSVISAGQLLGANMAFRRSLLMEIGGCDPAFGPGSPFRACDDTDLQTRASFAGATGIYHPGPLVWHHHGRKPGRDHKALVRNYAYARGAYYAKLLLNPRMRKPFLKEWYWWAAGKFRDKQYGGVFRDINGTLFRGGLCYLGFNLRNRGNGSRK